MESFDVQFGLSAEESESLRGLVEDKLAAYLDGVER